MEYPNLYKKQKIEASEAGAIRLEDDSVWRILENVSLPSKEVLEVGDEVEIRPLGAKRPDESAKSYKVVKDPKKQGFKVQWVNPTEKSAKSMNDNDISKSRKGYVDNKNPSDSEIIETDENYPEKWLDHKWSFGSIKGSSFMPETESKDREVYYVIIKDDRGSVWKLEEGNPGNWKDEDPVRIFRSKLKIGFYDIENLDKKDNRFIIVTFAGWLS